MKTYFVLLASVCLVFSSCNLFSNYGKKVEIGKSEVFYKGDGVTEAQAKAVGNFLKEHKWFDDETEASAQLSKEDGIYMVRLVMAEPENITASTKLGMWKQQFDLSQEVFDGKDARFVFTDNKFEDLAELAPVGKIEIGESAVFYDNSEYKKKEAQGLADLLKQKDYLGEQKRVDVFLVKENEVPVVRLVVDKDIVDKNGEELMNVFSYWQSLIQDNVLNDKKAKIILATVKMKDFKTVPKITDEVRQKFETPTIDQPQDNTVNMDSVSTQSTVSGVERINN